MAKKKSGGRAGKGKGKSQTSSKRKTAKRASGGSKRKTGGASRAKGKGKASSKRRSPVRTASSRPAATSGARRSNSAKSSRSKVGSSSRVKKPGGSSDFGTPARRARPRAGGRGKGPEQGTGPERAGSRGIRESAVGHAIGSPGAGSGGDIDTDVVGVGTGVGLAAGGPDETIDAAEFNSEESRSTRPAARTSPPAQQGEDADSLDHSGGSDEYSPPSANEQKSFGTGLDDDDIEEDQGE